MLPPEEVAAASGHLSLAALGSDAGALTVAQEGDLTFGDGNPGRTEPDH